MIWRFGLVALAVVTLGGFTLARQVSAGGPQRDDGSELVGKKAPSLDVTWIDPPRAQLGDGKGITLIRWWAEKCPYCSHTAPFLASLASRYGTRGLRVIGVMHPKPKPIDDALARTEMSPERVRGAARAIGLDGVTLAIDPTWVALRRWWLDGRGKSYTSVSFLVDRRGVIRWVHRGGEYHAPRPDLPDHADCASEAKRVEEVIEKLLLE